MLENEETLQSDIEKSIDDFRKKIRDICFKLHIRYDDLKFPKNIDSLSILEQNEAYKKEHKNLEKEVKKRLDEYKTLLSEESKLCLKLSLDNTEPVQSSIPSETDLDNLKHRITELQTMFESRKRTMIQLQSELNELCQELDTSRSDSLFSHCDIEAIIFESADNLTLGDHDMDQVTELRDHLKHKKEMLGDKIRSLRSKIVELWSKLNIENASVLALLSDNERTRQMSKRELVAELEREHERCVAIKMQNMQKFIETVRLEIRHMCSKMFVGDKEVKQMNQEFMCLDEYTEDLLAVHEEKLEDLKFRYIECQKLYEQTAEWTGLWAKFVQFEEKTKDPMRFKQRGYSMLEEEKQRKKFNAELPKLEEELRELAAEYASLNGGQQFTVLGQSLADFLLTTKLDYEESKQKVKIEKQVLKDTQRKNESRFGSRPKTPLALKNKRKIFSANHHDSNVNSPIRRSKLQKTDLLNTPGTSIMSSNRSVMGAAKAKVSSSLAAKSKLAKRKSRTPGNKRQLRRSKMMAKPAQQNDEDTTLKTTFSSTIQSTISSNSSKVRPNGSKCPPLSSSSRFAVSHTEHRMTSTASNTFIEDDDKLVDQDAMVMQASTKLTRMISSSKADSKLFNCDVNYLEFSRDLPKANKFGYDSTNSVVSSKTSGAKSKVASSRRQV
ncbi:regulator of cytokinesis 1 isoform X1 [Brachionus plicatilis]|uniref:Regulator of cytokinesis 1 isoform X1 n=1 Tax=Brachionus plicatilis TaxID=10195 RepID=A0A3M7TBI7_BRAPC|nr:regulator of cytokinesis 1 isoform X1 [Brachionus plicatilis]